ncbi:hypothetical protein B5K05_29080 [Rhizobium phaseoli]|nr:hypothetical protein B5K05_29080 [Rhizobium phaseoli]
MDRWRLRAISRRLPNGDAKSAGLVGQIAGNAGAGEDDDASRMTESMSSLRREARGRNLSDPLKARPPHGKGRLSAGPRAGAYPCGDRQRPAIL